MPVQVHGAGLSSSSCTAASAQTGLGPGPQRGREESGRNGPGSVLPAFLSQGAPTSETNQESTLADALFSKLGPRKHGCRH